MIHRIASRFLRRKAAEEGSKGDNIQLSSEDEKLLGEIWEDLAKEGMGKKAFAGVEEESAKDPASKGSVFGSDAFQEFWKAKYQAGKKRVPNTDPKTRQRYDKVTANTLLSKDKEFRKKVLEEFRKWQEEDGGEDSEEDAPPAPAEEKRYKNVEFSFEMSDEEDSRELAKSFGLSLEDVADAAGLAGLPPTVKRVRVLASTDDNTIRVIASDGKDPPKGWKFDRRVNLEKRSITNELFFIPEDSPAGTGVRVFGEQVRSARKHGFKEIQCNAYTEPPKWVGGIVWPKLGYDGPLPKGLHKKAGKLLKETPKPWKISHLMMKGKEGQDLWKNNVPAEVQLSFELGESALSSKVLDAYMKAKGL